MLFKVVTSLTTVFIVTSLAFSIYYFQEVREIDEEIAAVRRDSEEDRGYRLALITEQMDHEYWHIVEEGVREAETDLDVDVKYLGTRRTNYEEQYRLMDMQIAGGVDGIIVQAVSEEMFQPLINKAIDRNIPVVTIDTDAPSSNRLSYIGTDNYQAGFTAGEALVNDLGETGNIAIITNSLTSTHQRLRVQGFEDAISEYEELEIIRTEVSNNTRIEAEQEALAILREEEEVDAFYGTSALDGLGITEALKEHPQKEEIYTIVFDSLDETLALLRSGEVDTIISQQPYEMGYKSVETLVGLLNGESYPEIQHTVVDVLRQDNLADFPFDGRDPR
ncbi:monosaccharide ABC transporter substrate-binding protein, CUT2 family [Pelagirhabdus alkalitolerans]|uniref:Monosaccharide ABC transporter substrate-binding protein, CUT2 family n=1 Tax=Pelagirhabdus alkalitolerans TaxID=1612202 RepID=A0A1G6LDW6_9BACI|nr:sugar-binding protein [Pelagirhabdus alkalitolerans]SDC41404.1 monosaccharide ABC transporter substrate-binding protein, CUT2 family [Pelagirhabdus alkalitolerans]